MLPSLSAMEAPKRKTSILLPALGLVGAVAVSMAIELFVPRPKSASAPDPPERKPPPGTTIRQRDMSSTFQTAAPDPTREQRIRERAFWIWVEEGKPQGRDEEHWRKAEAEVPE
jgi:hypothetical protein